MLCSTTTPLSLNCGIVFISLIISDTSTFPPITLKPIEITKTRTQINELERIELLEDLNASVFDISCVKSIPPLFVFSLSITKLPEKYLFHSFLIPISLHT
jgi:hypothetical protein